MSSSAVKRKLSGSINGRGIKVGASPATTIHTAISGTTDGSYDEIWLWAINTSASDVALTIEYGGETNPDDYIIVKIPAKAGMIPIVPGFILQNGCVVKAFAATADVIILHGFVNRMND